MSDLGAGFEREVHVPILVRWVLAILVLAASAFFALVGWVLSRADPSTFVDPVAGQALIFFVVLLAIGFGFVAFRLFATRKGGAHLFSARAAMTFGIGSTVVGLFLLAMAAYSGLLDIASSALFPIAIGIYLYSSGRKRRARHEP